MKTPKEILAMNKEELEEYKWSVDLNPRDNENCSRCPRCSRCYDCSDCSDCLGCFDCYRCRNAGGLKYAICNVEVGKEAYEKKMKELNF